MQQQQQLTNHVADSCSAADYAADIVYIS